MSDEEIKKALEIIKNKAINIEIVNDIVDKKEYIGFDKDNFEILEQCYYNCQYFARNLEQLMINLKDKDKEIKKLNYVIKKAIHFINLNQDPKKLTLNYDDLKKLRGILNDDEYYLTLFEEQLNELKENS